MTDVSIKRKWRDYVFEMKRMEREAWKPWKEDGSSTDPGYDIFVRHSGVLANQQRVAIADSQKTGFDGAKPIEKKDKERDKKIGAATEAACRRFVDVRTFGAVMTTGKVDKVKDKPDAGAEKSQQKEEKAEWNCGQVKGPVQLTFARSVHKIAPVQWSITRVAQTNPGDNQATEGGESEHGTFGQKPTIGYALYRAHGFVSASLAEKTWFGPKDLQLLFEALANMYDRHHSSSAGMQSTVALYVFEHNDKYGKYHAHRLLDAIKTDKNEKGPWVKEYPTKPECFCIKHDFSGFKESKVPDGVTLWKWDFDDRKLVQVAKGQENPAQPNV